MELPKKQPVLFMRENLTDQNETFRGGFFEIIPLFQSSKSANSTGTRIISAVILTQNLRMFYYEDPLQVLCHKGGLQGESQ